MFLKQIAERSWPATAIHDTVRAVLRNPAFSRSAQRSIVEYIVLWIGEMFHRLQQLLKNAPSARSVALGGIALLVVLVVARLVVEASARSEKTARSGRGGRGLSADDPWMAADLLASQGRYEEAAHALYRGVVLGLSRDERLRLDPSKTSGDYARELRRRGSSSLGAFRAFVRRFDVAVYGHGGCDEAAVAELRELSAPFRSRARAA
jgi:Domain of unknown function (DUF4129)